MNFIKLSTDEEIRYPVGRDMAQTMSIVVTMAEALKQLFPVNQPKNELLQFYVRGSSGAIIAGILVALMPEHKIQIFHIKKEGESSHGSGSISWDAGYASIIVDDFMASGDTVNSIYKKVKSKHFDFKVNVLCLSSTVVQESLHFEPDYIIAGKLN